MQPAWAVLSPFARLVLVHMATVAYDYPSEDQPARLYWAGHAPIILFLTGVPEGAPGYAAAYRRVTRAVKELLTAGAIARTFEAKASMRAVYEITTNQSQLPVDNSPVETVEKSPSDGV